MTHDPPRTPQSTDRVAIIGAGPAGLTMAEELRLAGYREVTVYEARGRVGGKVHSPLIDGIPCEAGTVWRVNAPIYRRYAERFGISWRAPARRPAVRVIDQDGGRPMPPLLRPTDAPPLRRLAQLARYLVVIERMRRLDSPGFAGPLLRRPDLARSMPEWFDAHGLGHVYRSIGAVLVNAGVGRPSDTIPFPYFLKLLLLLQRYDLRSQLTLSLPYFREGNDALWQAVAAHHDVRRKATVRRIERGSPTRIVTTDGTFEADHVVWTGPLDALSRVLDPELDSDGTLARAASRLRTLTRVVVTCRTEGLPSPLFLQIQGHHRRAPNYPVSAYEVAPRAQLYNFYAFMRFADHVGAPLTLDEITQGIERMALDLGGRLRSVEAVHVWEHWFPHFGLDDYRDGIYPSLEHAQGRGGVFVLGEALAGITVPAAMEYAASLRDRFFPRA